MSVVATILVVGLLILVHEAGHYVAARLARIPVERFSIGIGPALWSVRRAGTDFRIAALPVGGYVLPAVEDAPAWFRIPILRRILFALGGPVANLLLPLPLLALAYVVRGEASFGHLCVAPFADLMGMLSALATGLVTLLGQPEALSGVVGIVVEGSRFMGGDPAGALRFTAFLSVNLAVFNLLPIPALDGGRILLALVEKIHPRTERLQLALTAAGWVVIALLLVYTLGLDLRRYLA